MDFQEAGQNVSEILGQLEYIKIQMKRYLDKNKENFSEDDYQYWEDICVGVAQAIADFGSGESINALISGG